ncbi:MAG: PPC domain-containing protein, partial [Planctomycetes bacterium]|nr:PPC domain-containing protein [Planctomycetota bacterium]
MPDRFSTKILGFILLLTASVSALADPLPSVEDEEPNDTVATATATGLVDLGTAIVAGAEVGNGPLADADRDLFWFEVTAKAALPALLTVAFDGADAAYDGYVRLFDGAGVELLNHDDAGYPDELSPLLQTYVVVPGRYYIGVSHAMNPGYDATDDQTGRPAETGGYDLAIILSEITEPDSSLEPNDVEPTEIDSFPALITNQFIGDGPDPARDVDQYGFDVEGPAIVIAEVRPTQLGLLDPLLESRILANESLRSDTKIKRLEIAVFEAGAVRISVTSWFRSGQDTYGFYDLFVDVTPVSATDGPYEPNDSLLEATQTGLSGPGSANFSAHIGDGVFGELRGDVDFYELTLGFDELLEVDVSPTGEPPNLTPVVHLYDFLGSHVAIWMPDESGSVRGSFQRRCADVLQLPGEEPENYVVVVMGAGDRVTMDPLIPNPESPGWPSDVRFALHALDGGAGSTGAYDAGFTISSNPLADCADEPDDKIPDAGAPVLIDEGEFVCVSGM